MINDLLDQIDAMREALAQYSDQELIRLKWAAEGLVQAIRDERKARDARGIDDLLKAIDEEAKEILK